MSITLHLNGRITEVACAPETSLSEILREHLGQTDSKIACGIGRCGACLVLVDGKAFNSCLTPAWRIDGADIVTAAGLDDCADAKLLRAALVAENAFQCGYCAPGVSIALLALLRANPDAGETEIRAGLEGNICRCTGYHSILRGALSAAAMLRQARAKGDIA